MDNTKKFEDFLGRIQGLLDNAKKQGHIIVRVEDIEKTFPELIENEDKDENIRKSLISKIKDMADYNGNFIAGNYDEEQIIAWLEKQGEQKPIDKVGTTPIFSIGDTLKRKGKDYTFIVDRIQGGYYHCDHSNGAFFPIEEQDNWELVGPKQVDPKFKVGDWVVNKYGDSWHIDSFDRKNYQVSNGEGNYNYFSISHQDEMRLWTIQDAKDGDILALDNENCPFIYRTKTVFGNPVAYCGVRSDGLFISKSPKDHQWCLKSEVIPATKEQRDLLFSKMKEAGYEWDADKKELKKIEDEPENYKQQVMSEMTDLVKDYIHQNPAWSKEDERLWHSCIAHIEDELEQIRNDKYGHSEIISDNKESCRERIKWLKSIKERYIWKPTDEQMEALADALSLAKNCGEERAFDLRTLYEQLQKIKEDKL